MVLQDEELVVLVNSCDKYADVWPVFFTLFWRYWPDYPFAVYLGTNQKDYPHPRVRVVKVGADESWSATTWRMLEELYAPYVLWFLEDFLLFEPVDTMKIRFVFAELQRLDGNCLRLRPSSALGFPVAAHPEIEEILPGTPYRCSLGNAIWRRHVLIGLLEAGESPWQMELNGSRRSDRFT